MCVCTIIYPIFFAAHAFTLETVLEQCSYRRLVAVDEGTHFITLVYCDPFYELLFNNYLFSS